MRWRTVHRANANSRLVLERARQMGASETDILKMYPTLRADDPVNAWAYVQLHREEIEQQIRENEEV